MRAVGTRKTSIISLAVQTRSTRARLLRFEKDLRAGSLTVSRLGSYRASSTVASSPPSAGGVGGESEELEVSLSDPEDIAALNAAKAVRGADALLVL